LAASPAGRAQLQGNAAANADRATFNNVQQQLQLDIDAAGAEADLLLEIRDQVQQILATAQSRGPEFAGGLLQQLRLVYEAHLLRARELHAHALDESQMGHVLMRLDTLGFSAASVRPLFYQTHLMGWALRADRA
jgi:hypothetical protein